MRPIPVVATIREAYTFAVTHLGGIIGLIWVPMLLLTVAQFFTLHRYYNDFIDFLATNDEARMGPSLLMMMGFIVAALLLYAVIFVAVVQLVQGTRAGGAIAHFAFGPPEWRMFRAFAALAGLVLLIALTVTLGVTLLSSLAGTVVPVAATAANGVAVLSLVVICMALAARFLLLLPAISVNEGEPVLRRAWALSHGNFWRLLAVLAGIFGPILLLLVVLETVLTGRTAVPAGAAEQVQLLAGIMRAREVLPLVSGLGFFVSPLVTGLFASASVSVWRALTGQGDGAPDAAV
ncbi:MAG TPA: hypothetical protein VHC40_04500 [Rhizomicrobium sp.]|nr:hypothetical protein [Rhizomicrobium sp.]